MAKDWASFAHTLGFMKETCNDPGDLCLKLKCSSLFVKMYPSGQQSVLLDIVCSNNVLQQNGQDSEQIFKSLPHVLHLFTQPTQWPSVRANGIRNSRYIIIDFDQYFYHLMLKLKWI